MSGALTVFVQPSVALCPIRIMGAPGKVTPCIDHPSPEPPSFDTSRASYHAATPNHGWCELLTKTVEPSAMRDGASAKALLPRSSGGPKVALMSSPRPSTSWPTTPSSPKNSGLIKTKPSTMSRSVTGNTPRATTSSACSAA